MFRENPMKYKVPAWKGKTFCCRICNFKQSAEPVVRYIDGKFKVVKLTFLERINEFLSK